MFEFLRRIVPLVLLVGCCLTTATSKAQSGKLLRWTPSEGDELRVEILQKSSQRTRVANRPITTSTEMKMSLDWSIQSIDQQGTIAMTQTITHLRLQIDVSGGDSIQFDSAAEETPRGAVKNIADGVRPLIGAKVQVSMSDRGEILDVQIPAELRKAIEERPQSRIGQLFSKDGLKETLGQAAVVFPEEPISPGDTWSQSTKTSSPIGLLRQERTYTYQGTEQHDGHPVEKIEVTSNLQIEQSSDGEVRLELIDQQQSGTVLFDAQAGRIVRSEVAQQLTTETPYRDTTIRVVVDSSSVTTIELPNR